MTFREAFHHLFGWRCVTPAEPINDAHIQEIIMAVSQAFQTALDTLGAAYAAKETAAVAAVQAQLDAANANQASAVAAAAAQVDADDTAAVVAATPAS